MQCPSDLLPLTPSHLHWLVHAPSPAPTLTCHHDSTKAP
ncbi:hypothetical protein E2C01_081135 [Portunus trituberculatus]|uniref:Uncharacterized protein n=1 Tax=Portunus trituberculatus TaxID=210409 RepID=A0A5B7IR54_PORTR|nr:hypothetical protein [Portunus trituberculatus]